MLFLTKNEYCLMLRLKVAFFFISPTQIVYFLLLCVQFHVVKVIVTFHV